MAKNPIARVVTTLDLSGVTLGIYTNNLAAYEALKNQLPAPLKSTLISYSTVNRAVQNAGQYLEIPTTLGIFTITKKPVFRFFTIKNNNDIAGEQSALLGSNADGNAI